MNTRNKPPFLKAETEIETNIRITQRVHQYFTDNVGTFLISLLAFFFISLTSLAVWNINEIAGDTKEQAASSKQMVSSLQDIKVGLARNDAKNAEQDKRLIDLELYKKSHEEETKNFFRDYDIKKKSY